MSPHAHTDTDTQHTHATSTPKPTHRRTHNLVQLAHLIKERTFMRFVQCLPLRCVCVCVCAYVRERGRAGGREASHPSRSFPIQAIVQLLLCVCAWFVNVDGRRERASIRGAYIPVYSAASNGFFTASKSSFFTGISGCRRSFGRSNSFVRVHARCPAGYDI